MDYVDDETRDRMLAAQHGKCAICLLGNPTIMDVRPDEDGENFRPRGIVCAPCFNMIESAGFDPIRLQWALEYIMEDRDVEPVDPTTRKLRDLGDDGFNIPDEEP